MRAEKKKLILNHCLAAFIIGGVLSIYHLIFGSACILKGLTGIDCPFCGMTRAFVAAFIHFDFKEAFAAHPLFPIALPFLLLCIHEGIKYMRKGYLRSCVQVSCQLYNLNPYKTF